MSLDISAGVDELIKDFPGNANLQFKLGLGEDVLDNPYKFLHLVPFYYDLFPDCGVLRCYLGECLKDETFRSSGGDELTSLFCKLVRLLNRYAILKMISQTKVEVIPGLPPKLARIYFLTSEDGYVAQICDIVRIVGPKIDQVCAEQNKVAELFK